MFTYPFASPEARASQMKPRQSEGTQALSKGLPLRVGDLQGQLYAFGVELERVGDVAEGTAFAQVLAHGLEVVFAYGLAQLQAGGGDDLLWRVTPGIRPGVLVQVPSKANSYRNRALAHVST